MSKEPSTQLELTSETPMAIEPKKNLTPIQLFESHLQRYESSVLIDLLSEHHIKPAAFKQIVLKEIKKNPKLLEAFVANPSSMFASIFAGAEIGLIPSDMLGEFYLIPRTINNKPTVTALIGYKGLVNILLRSGDVTRIHTEIVYEGDEFQPIYGLEPNIIHVPNFSTQRTNEKITFVYSVAKLKNGEFQFVVLSKSDIKAIQLMSKYTNDLYFNDKKDPMNWMIKKVAIMQLSKLLPKDYHGKQAVEMNNQLEGGAMLTLDEDNKVVIVDGKRIAATRQSTMAGINELPDIPE